MTLTGVETAPDLAHAKVFVSVYGKQAEKDATMEGYARRAALPAAAHQPTSSRSKRTPTLDFVYDESVDQGMRIQALLKSSGAADLPPADEEDEGGPERPRTGFRRRSRARNDARHGRTQGDRWPRWRTGFDRRSTCSWSPTSRPTATRWAV